MAGEPLEIAIDQDECIGCSACVSEAPETFDMTDDNKAFVKPPPHDELEYIVAAAEACPIDSIRVTSPDGTPLYPQA
jgi:ferredoxin